MVYGSNGRTKLVYCIDVVFGIRKPTMPCVNDGRLHFLGQFNCLEKLIFWLLENQILIPIFEVKVAFAKSWSQVVVTKSI